MKKLIGNSVNEGGLCDWRIFQWMIEWGLMITLKFQYLKVYWRLVRFLKGMVLPATMTVVLQSLSRVWLFVTPWTAAHQASLSVTNSQSLLKLMFIELVMPSNDLVLWHPLLLPFVFLSIRVFSNESVLWIRWSKYWSFSFNISPSNEYSELISFKTGWFDLLAFQGKATLIGVSYIHWTSNI